MPRITIEEKIPVTDRISQVKTTTYELPNSIVYNNETLYFDAYYQSYTNNKDVIISAVNYLNMILKTKNKQNNSEEECDIVK